jgi:Leucine Rich Repeat (LRR) protein
MVVVSIVLPQYREARIESRLMALGAQCETKVIAPNWLRSLVGDAWLSPLRRINIVIFNFIRFKDVQLEDDDLAILAGLSNLERLSLNRTRIGDDALRHLEGLQSLKILQLVDTDITDEGIEHLTNLTQLETLDLWRTQVTNEGLKPLRSLPNLRQLRRPDGHHLLGASEGDAAHFQRRAESPLSFPSRGG